MLGTRQLRTGDRFQIIRELGVGGMGVVYEALDRTLGTRVALKTVADQSGELLLRLKNEFRVLADLHHPNLISLGELYEEDGVWFFSMELVEGVDLVSYVRRSASPPSAVSFSAPTQVGGVRVEGDPAPAEAVFDEARLRSSFSQLALGLAAVHTAGTTHRDIKPNNVLVTRKGRVVLLDFGLVTAALAWDRSLSGHTVGTADYMAPEQAAGQEVEPAADWYAAGVVLYEALTGRLPIAGNPIEVMMRKQSLVPARPSEIADGVPADLDALCARLLEIDPARRPDGATVIAKLGQSPAALKVPSSPSTNVPIYVGRQAELSQLRRAFQDCQDGGAPVVLVEGDCGVGKSALVHQVALEFELAGAVVLAGRCHEREVVPFKAIDGVVDALSRYLGHLSDVEAAVVIPRNAGLLGEVFPVLRRVRMIAQARRSVPGHSPIDPQEQRTRLFAAMRELLARLADRRQVVLILDDLQWADADSLALLAEVLRWPDPPGLLTIAIRRTGTASDGEPAVDDRWLPAGVRRLLLGPLPSEEATQLAAFLLRHQARSVGVSAAEIADEAGGLPLFIHEIIHHIATTGRRLALVASSLDDALAARVAALPPEARVVLELLAVAGAPLVQEVLVRAAEMPVAEVARLVSLLRIGHLVQTTTGETSRGQVAPFHDRVRDAVLRRLEPAALQSCHLALATALEGQGAADAELLALHWRGAGDITRADQYDLQAAAEAEAAFAFGHAASLYRKVVDRHAPSTHAGWQLRSQLANALANAGRGGEAAGEYLTAATTAPPAEQLDFRRRAAEQYLRSGHIDDGLTAIQGVLEAVGMTMPRSPRRSLLSLLFQRARLRLRGLGFDARDSSQIPQETLARLDTCSTLASCLSTVDTIRGTYFNCRHLVMALDSGEPRRLVRAVAQEAIFAALPGPTARPKIDRLLQVIDAIAEQLDEPVVSFWRLSGAGASRYYLGEFRACHEWLTQAIHIAREQCAGFVWELSTARLWDLWAIYYLGQLTQVRARVPQLLGEALERGDFYAAANLQLSITNGAWLIGDEVDEAERMRSEALQRWSRQNFHTQHWFDLTAQAQIGLYLGDPTIAAAEFERLWQPLQQSLLLRVQLVRLEAFHLRARCRLQLAGKRSGTEREGLLVAVERDARQIRREKAPWGLPLAELLSAGVDARRGNLEGAKSRLLAAIAGLKATEMGLFREPARRRLGQLLGGDAGDRLVAATDAVLAAQGVKDIDRWLQMLTPGFD